jgi:hypothetical protein
MCVVDYHQLCGSPHSGPKRNDARTSMPHDERRGWVNAFPKQDAGRSEEGLARTSDEAAVAQMGGIAAYWRGNPALGIIVKARNVTTRRPKHDLPPPAPNGAN